jgi:hypothetical protein
MRVVVGMIAHSGWAALVAVGQKGSEIVVVDRRRIDLVEEEWAKQPYHAAENLRPDQARDVVQRGIASAHRIAAREMEAEVGRERARGNHIAGCAVLVGKPMPNWTIDEVLAVHFRMHKAEGVLFRDCLLKAAEACGLKTHAVSDTLIRIRKEKESTLLAALGKTVGSPWGKDQKDAVAAALIALRG